MNTPPLPSWRGFQSATHASEHLCDHVLTRPEAHDWPLVITDFRQHVDPVDDAGLRRLAASLFAGEPHPAALALRGAYLAELLETIDDARRLGWWWSEGPDDWLVWHGVGLDGTYVVWDRRVIRTGYLPGSSSHPPRGTPRPRQEEPLPRRDFARRHLSAQTVDTDRARYELFKTGIGIVTEFYHRAYQGQAVRQDGGQAFVQRPVRIGRWSEELGKRPGASDRGKS